MNLAFFTQLPWPEDTNPQRITPDQCVAKIKQLQKHGVQYLGCNFDFGGMEHKKVLKAMELFSKEVVPRLG